MNFYDMTRAGRMIRMKLSPAFLAYKLSSAFSVLAPENLPLSGTLELPVLYQTGSAATAHRVFLCTEEQIGSLSSLPEESSSLFLLCTEELPEELPAPVSIAVKSSVSAVFSFLQELFWTYDSWQKELMQARLDGKSIQHLFKSLPACFCPPADGGRHGFFHHRRSVRRTFLFSREGVWLPRCNAPASALLDRKQRIRVRPRSRWMVPLSGSRNGTWFPLRQHHAAWSERLRLLLLTRKRIFLIPKLSS